MAEKVVGVVSERCLQLHLLKPPVMGVLPTAGRLIVNAKQFRQTESSTRNATQSDSGNLKNGRGWWSGEKSATMPLIPSLQYCLNHLNNTSCIL